MRDNDFNKPAAGDGFTWLHMLNGVLLAASGRSPSARTATWNAFTEECTTGPTHCPYMLIRWYQDEMRYRSFSCVVPQP
jgi:hypothetical protein